MFSLSVSELDAIRWHFGAERFRVFVETGLKSGGTFCPVATSGMFLIAHAIELDAAAVESVRARLEMFPVATDVQFHVGNSGVKLRQLVEAIDEPVLFHLDAHSPGLPTPLFAELGAIRDRQARGLSDVVIVDDVHAFRSSDPAWKNVSVEAISKTFDPRPPRPTIVNDRLMFRVPWQPTP